MQTSSLSPRLFGAIIFLAGVLLIFMLAILAIWADTEAVFYGFEKLGDERLNTLRCPVLLTSNKAGIIRANFANTGDKAIDLTIHTSFSGLIDIRKQNDKLPLEAHETKPLAWEVTAQNVDMRFFVFAQVGHYAARLMPFRYSTCGMVMINVPFLSGDQLFALWYFLGIGSLLGGMALWNRFSQPLEGKRYEVYRAMRFLAIMLLSCLFVALQGWWVIGILLVAAVILAIISMLAWALMA